MNERKWNSGCVTHEHILKSGFIIDKEHTVYATGDEFTLIDYSKGGVLFLTGGYWHYKIKTGDGTLVWEGWPNSNEEFDTVISTIESELQNVIN